jgi:sortase A
MNPQTNHDDQLDSDSVPKRSHDHAANVVRGQLDAIYSNQENPPSSRLSSRSDQPPNHWQQYHNQWQDYYQKYYERYYVGHLHRALNEQAKASQSPAEKQEEAVVELRQKILSNAKESAKKARKSRHFIPVASALAVVFVVAFLQYNQIFIANVQAYISPGGIDPQNIITDPTAQVSVGPEPKLIIPKINVDVPVIYGVPNDQKSLLKGMEKGVVHFSVPGASSVPGQIGNTVISGHSSNDIFDPGDYKFIFVQLDKLVNGDTIYVNNEGKRYTYVVTKKQEVQPSNVSALIYPTDKPILTLITCTPVGTTLRRLLVTAEQVSPDPNAARAAPSKSDDNKANFPGTSPTIIERIFGGGT